MSIETNRSNRIAFVVGLAVVAFAVGLALALWGSGGYLVTRVVGALGIVAGFFLLTSRNLFKRDAGVPPDLQIPAERRARMGMRIVGATGILVGVAQFIPDTRMQTAVMVCAAAVSLAGVFKVPRRLFNIEGGAD
jgi:hypothetical protein